MKKTAAQRSHDSPCKLLITFDYPSFPHSDGTRCCTTSPAVGIVESNRSHSDNSGKVVNESNSIKAEFCRR